MRRRRVAVLGSTGTIGRATLSVLESLPERFEVCALAAHRSARVIAAQAKRLGVRNLVLTDLDACTRTRNLLSDGYEVAWGIDPLIDIARAPRTDIVVVAMNGTAALLPTVTALEKGKRVAIATKELLVGFGSRIMSTARRNGGQLLPIDSELSALHQCMRGGRPKEVRRVVLTASGGPFWREGPPVNASVRDVLQHPTWRMGRKITVDSATMMNKGLEVIETARLFSLKPEQIRVVIHPQSIVHSFVEFVDGSLLAQLSRPDMRLPIQYALAYPDRVPSLAEPLDVRRMGSLAFVTLRPGRFGCFDLARKALVAGPAATCVLNAANQVVVEAFLAGQVVFGDIPAIIRRAVASSLTHSSARPALNPGIRTLLRLEARAVDCAVEQVRRTAAQRSRSAGRC